VGFLANLLNLVSENVPEADSLISSVQKRGRLEILAV
jgi:hypothetical protein